MTRLYQIVSLIKYERKQEIHSKLGNNSISNTGTAYLHSVPKASTFVFIHFVLEHEMFDHETVLIMPERELAQSSYWQFGERNRDPFVALFSDAKIS